MKPNVILITIHTANIFQNKSYHLHILQWKIIQYTTPLGMWIFFIWLIICIIQYTQRTQKHADPYIYWKDKQCQPPVNNEMSTSRWSLMCAYLITQAHFKSVNRGNNSLIVLISSAKSVELKIQHGTTNCFIYFCNDNFYQTASSIKVIVHQRNY